MSLNKQQLEAVNQANFPDNNSQLITPSKLREFNTDIIDSIQLTGSYATTGSNTFVGNQTIIGDLSVSGVISASVLYVQTETASVIYSSGSNQFGDELTDVQTLSGSVKIQGQLLINGVPLSSGSATVDTGSLVTTASFNAYTQSTNLRLNSLETNSASVNVSISNLNTTTASLSTSITNINQFTQSQSALNGTFATTGSNTFTGNQIIDRASKLYTNGVYWTDMTSGYNNLEIINQGGGNLDFASLNGGRMRVVNTPLQLTGSALSSNSDISTSANIYAANLTGSGTIINTGSFATTGSNTFTGTNSFSGGIDTIGGISMYQNGLFMGYPKQMGDPFDTNIFIATPRIIGQSSSGNNLILAGDTMNNRGVTVLNSLGVTGSVVVSRRQVGMSFVGGDLNLESTFTASLQQGYVWVGDSTGRTVTVATSSFGGGASINTGSFATTGSNVFVGNQTITGSLLISGSETIVGELTSSRLRVNSATSLGGTLSVAFDTIMRGDLTVESTSPQIKLRDNGAGGFSSGYDLRVDTGSFEIHDDTHNRDVLSDFFNSSSQQHTTSLTSEIIVISGSTSVTLIGNVSASIISASTINGLGDPLAFSQSVDSRINSIVTGTGFATTGSNTFRGQQTILADNAITISGSGFGYGITLQGQQGIKFEGSGGPRIQFQNATWMQGGENENFNFIADTDNPLTRGLDFFLYGTGSRQISFRNNSGPGASMQFALNSGSMTFNAGQSISLTGSTLQMQGFTYPTTDGTPGQVLSTNGSKVLSFTTVSGSATINTGSFATTGSNSFNGDQNITGSVRISSQLQFGTSNFGPTIQTLPSGTPSGDTGLQVNAGLSGSFSMRTLYGGGVGDAILEAYDTFPSFTRGGKIFAKSAGGASIFGFAGDIDISGSNTIIQNVNFIPFSASVNARILAITGSGGTINTGSFATTGSNTFTGTQNINEGVNTTFNMQATAQNVLFFNSPNTFMQSTGNFSFNNNGFLGGSGSLTFSVSNNELNLASDNGVRILRTSTGGPASTGAAILVNHSGSLVLSNSTANPTSLSHISSSQANANTNLIFKTNTATVDTIVSGSGNIFVNASAATAGFKRYIGNNNIALFGLPQISGSMQWSPTINGNYFGALNPINIRGAISASVMQVSQNAVLGLLNIGQTAILNAEKLTGQTNISSNVIAGTFNIVANQSDIRGITNVSNNNINGNIGLSLSSSAVTMVQNSINDNNFSVVNQFSSGGIGFGQAAFNVNTIGGSGNQFIITGSQPVASVSQAGMVQNLVLGQSNTAFVNSSGARVSGTNIYHNMVATSLLGNRLVVTGSSNNVDTTSFGSAFVGRFNATDGIRDRSSDVIFAVGTGTSVSARKTGFLIDSGSNSFFEGAVNISGSLLVNGTPITSIATGSFATTGSNSFVGANTFSGSVAFTGSVVGNVVALGITSNTASMNFNSGNYFTLTLADNATTHISASNVQPGVSATLVITTGTNSTASLAPTLLQPSGLEYSATVGTGKKDVLSIVAVEAGVPYVVSTKNMV